ncbi:hypothetical protein [Prosthecobacter fluviatilis]|uniref:Transmembrane protein n=1 Tax=Prosthecobacter fluviatilis TaxID=445931 RepID=A0ABW0KS94_9BACT
MNTHRHQRPLVFISFPFLAVIVLVALLASLTLAVFNKVHQRSRTHPIPVPAMTPKNQD